MNAHPTRPNVQEVRRRPVHTKISTGQVRVVHKGAKEIVRALSGEESLLDDVVKLAQEKQLLSSRELTPNTFFVTTPSF